MLAATIAGLLNLGFHFIQLALYHWERRKGYLVTQGASPGQIRKFLAPHDYYAGKWGDTIGLTMMNIGVGWVFFNETQFLFWMAIPFVFAVATSIGYYNYCRLANKNDWTFTRGKITRAGVVHLMYIFYGVTVGTIGIGFLASGRLDAFMIAGLAGALFYLLTVIFDVRAGHHGS